MRVEVACGGGKGRTGTALACIAQLGGVAASGATAWARRHYDAHAVETPWQRRYDAHAVETPWQRRYVRRFAAAGAEPPVRRGA
nr:hypothetical protein [Conexibacter woesei]